MRGFLEEGVKMQDIKSERIWGLVSSLEKIIESNSLWLTDYDFGVTTRQLSNFLGHPHFLGVDSDPSIAGMVMNRIVGQILIDSGKVDFNRARIYVYGRDKLNPTVKYSLVYVGDIEDKVNIFGEELDKEGLVLKLSKKYPHIKIVTDQEIIDVASQVNRDIKNISYFLLDDGPLRLLVVSHNEMYRSIAIEFFSQQEVEGTKLFDPKGITIEELAQSLESSRDGNYPTDVLLFDLHEGIGLTDEHALPLLDRYLARHQNTHTIVTLTGEQWENLTNNSIWDGLQRVVVESPAVLLTYSLRNPNNGKKLTSQRYLNYFLKLSDEFLYNTMLTTICELRIGSKGVRRRIANLPAQFTKFAARMNYEFGKSQLVKEGIDIMASFNPDATLKLLKGLQPENDQGYSIPQHCYPPFDRLQSISQQEVLDIVLGKDIDPLSFYVHIPFCPSRCKYCDYTTITVAQKQMMMEYLNLLNQEMENYYALTGREKLSPRGVQLGGGTPTYYPPHLIKELGRILHQHLDIPEDAQLTFEVSPVTTTPEKLDAFKEIGAKRASIGLQSPADEALMHWVRRIYTSRKGMEAVEELLKRWPDNTNADLMFGFPGQTPQSWERDLEAAISWGIPSLTFYNMRVSPRTGYDRTQEFPGIYPRMLMYIMAVQKALSEKFVQSSDNHFVRSTQDQPYIFKDVKKRGGSTLGIGLSSYSIFPGNKDEPGIIYFNQGGRDPVDYDNFNRYSQAVNGGELPVEIGLIMNVKEQMRLFTVQGLKLSGVGKDANGVDMSEFKNRFAQSIVESFPHTLQLVEHGLLSVDNNYIGLTYKGLVFEELVLKTYWR